MAKKNVATFDHVKRLHISFGLPWLAVPSGAGIELCDGDKAAGVLDTGVLQTQYYVTTVVGSPAFVVFSHRSLSCLIKHASRFSRSQVRVRKAPRERSRP